MAASPVGDKMRFSIISGSQLLCIMGMVLPVSEAQPQVLSAHPVTLISPPPCFQSPEHPPGRGCGHKVMSKFLHVCHKHPRCWDFKAGWVAKVHHPGQHDPYVNGPVAEVCVKLRRPTCRLDLLKAMQITKPKRDHIFILADFIVQIQINTNCSHQIMLL